MDTVEELLAVSVREPEPDWKRESVGPIGELIIPLKPFGGKMPL